MKRVLIAVIIIENSGKIEDPDLGDDATTWCCALFFLGVCRLAPAKGSYRLSWAGWSLL